MAVDPYTPPVADQPDVPDPADMELADFIVPAVLGGGAVVVSAAVFVMGMSAPPL